jgi:2-polyprenyl-6-hydroxyphenyl methylase / 3-demethylubiquinone-9 3-methyltransferase
MSDQRLTKEELLAMHDATYVQKYHKEGALRIGRLLHRIEVKSTDRILDAACGNGLLLDYIHDKVAEYWGVDFSQDFIDAATKRFTSEQLKSAHFVAGDLVAFCAERQNYFDKAFAIDFTEHIYDDDFQKIFTAIHASLKPGGELLIHTPNGEYLLEVLKNKGFMKQFPEHIGVRKAEPYIRLLAGCGYRNIQVTYISHHVPLLAGFDFLRHLPLVGKYFQARLIIRCEQ